MNSFTMRSLMVATLIWGGLAKIALAQILPDATLGSESSVVNETLDPGTTWIEGGATRSTALFHSFLNFNVNDGQRVYFVNPPTIETIFSRVTGGNPSQILGTLGVGGSADLFLINPQGILFGPGARLDLSGSFTASTAQSLIFGNGLEFSSINPAAPPLLQVNIQPGLQEGLQEIQSLGALKAGKNLTLHGESLNISGSLQAGGNVLLQGQTITLNDRPGDALKVIAGGDLTLEGANALNISALSHPNSLFYGGNHLTLRSNQPVIGDGHFYSGGGFRVETLAGDLNRLASPEDPVIRTTGDVTLGSYVGSSLHILAGGSVTINDYLVLSGTDTLGALPQETITLSDGTPVTIDGAARPTLDIRAGITDPNLLAPSSELLPPEVLGTVSTSGTPPTRGDININGTVYIGDSVTGSRADNAQIVITNRWGCNVQCLPGDITLSKIIPDSDRNTGEKLGQLAELWVDSSGNLSLISGTDTYLDLSSTTGAGGNLSMISGEDLVLNGGYSIRSQGLQGGNINLRSTGGNVILNGDGTNGTTLSNASTVQGGIPAQGGTINLAADSGSILLQNGTRIENQGVTNGSANLGSIELTAFDTIRLSGLDSTITSKTLPGSTGNSGNIILTAPRIEILGNGTGERGAQLSTNTQGSGNAGNITLNAGTNGTVKIEEQSDIESFVDNTEATGQAGHITITTGDLEMRNSSINAETRGLGKAGNILVQVSNNALLDNSQFNTVVGVQAQAEGGNIDIQDAQDLTLTNNSSISSKVASNLPFKGSGNAGNITLANIQSITLENNSSLTSSTEGIGNAGTIEVHNSDRLALVDGSQISTAVTQTGEGNAGAIVLDTKNLTVSGASSIRSSTAGQGSAGSITVTADSGIVLDSSTLSTAIEPTGVANPDLPPSRITLTAGSVTLQNGAKITSETQGSETQGGTGDAGTIAIESAKAIELSEASSILSSVGRNARGNAGGIQLTAGETISLLDGSTLTASTAGRGNSGAIDLTTSDFYAEGESSTGTLSSVLSTVDVTGVGNSGGIRVRASNTLGLAFGARIDASTRGQGDSGVIDITAEDITLEEQDSSLKHTSSILSKVEATGVGNSGGIRIQAGSSINLLYGGSIATTTFGQGNSGAIDITTQDLLIQGEARSKDVLNNIENARISNIQSAVATSGQGNSGTITLTAHRSVSLLDGGQLNANTFGQGNSGAIDITTQDFLAQGQSQFRVYGSGVQSGVGNTGIGNSQGISLSASRTALLDGAIVSASTLGQGNSGAIVLDTQTLSLVGNSFITSSTEGQGSAGTITVTGANTVTVDGSNISTAIGKAGTATAGSLPSDIRLETQTLTLRNRATITASTAGQGSAGSIEVTGNGAFLLDNSSISAAIDPTGVANPDLPPSRITLTADSVTLQNGAKITSETQGSTTQGSTPQGGTGDAGTIAIEATGAITLRGGSSMLSSVGKDAKGNAGGIQLKAGETISVLEGSLLTASTSGQGDSGAIDITAQEFIAQGNDSAGIGSGIFSTVGTTATGDSGGIKLRTIGSVSLFTGAVLDATTSGQGDSGAIDITAQDIYLQGEDTAGFLSSVLSTVDRTGAGNSGGIRLTAKGTVSLSDGARLDASTFGRGDSGAIDITAQTVNIQGQNRSGEYNSSILSKVERTGLGNSGGIRINAGESVNLETGGVIATTTFGQGNSGAIDITTQDLRVEGEANVDRTSDLDNVQSAGISNIQSAVADSGRGKSGTITVRAGRSVSLVDGGQLNANTFGQGDSGAIVITTPDFLAQGISASGTYRSGIQSGVGESGIGNSQGIILNATNSSTFRDQALLSASTLGTAQERSNITVNTPNLSLDQGSNITASTAGFRDPGFNNAGKIEITTATTTLAGGSTIETRTSGSGDGGEIILTASEGLFLRGEGSGIFSDTEENSTGNAGNIFIDPPTVDIRDGAGISVNSLGTGTGGNITLAAGNLTLANNAFLSASTANSNGGQIFLTIAGNLLLLNNSYLSAAAGLGQAAGGNGGSITIDAGAIFGFNNGDISANAGLGNGGNITINSPILLGFLVENVLDTTGDFRNNISASGQASAGTITINNSVDPSKGLDPLAVNLADLASQVRQSCDISSAQTLNQFRIAGRGGLPSTPQDPLQSQSALTDLRLLEDWSGGETINGKTARDETVRDETIAFDSASKPIPVITPNLTLSEAGFWEWITPQTIRLSRTEGNTLLNVGIWSTTGGKNTCSL